MMLDRPFGERLAAVSHLRLGQSSIRVGWLFLAGTMTASGRSRRVFQPLLSRAVWTARPPLVGDVSLVPKGDVEVSEIVTDPEARQALEGVIGPLRGAFRRNETVRGIKDVFDRVPRLEAVVTEAVGTAGFEATELLITDDSPDQLLRHDGLV